MTASRECKGSDGIRSRKGGEWAKEKLDFLSRFGPVALTATAPIPRRVFVDLFAGPGLNLVRNGPEEFDGSPLRAIQFESDRRPKVSFTECWFVNFSKKDHHALSRRIDRRIAAGQSKVPRDSIHCVHGNANVEVRKILEKVDPRAYALFFVDMEAPKQCHWATISALREHRGHKSVDLYVLFPLAMALKRLISRNPKTVEESSPTLTAFFGNEEWRALLPLRAKNSDAAKAELGRGLLQLYERQLRRLWRHVGVVADINKGTNQQLYKMILASNHDAGRDIAKWAKQRAPKQLGLGL